VAARWLTTGTVAGCAASLIANGIAAEEARLVPYEIAGDAIAKSLTGKAGDPAIGRTIVVNRQVGLCLLCHAGPFPEEKLQGSLAPDLAGVGVRLSTGQLRLRVVDASLLKPEHDHATVRRA
jgi:sulfur-oxidizing protein SoxX